MDGLFSESRRIPCDTVRRAEQPAIFTVRRAWIRRIAKACQSLTDALQIVDFVIWLLFSRQHAAGTWPKHLLCDGYRKNVTRGAAGSVPGIFCLYPNQHVQILKEPPWPQLLMLLGKAGERIMINLLADCSVFTSVKAGHGNLFQLSGVSFSEVDFGRPGGSELQQPVQGAPSAQAAKKSSEIVFAKARMLYARAALNAQGQVQFGLRHIRETLHCA